MYLNKGFLKLVSLSEHSWNKKKIQAGIYL